MGHGYCDVDSGVCFQRAEVRRWRGRYVRNRQNKMGMFFVIFYCQSQCLCHGVEEPLAIDADEKRTMDQTSENTFSSSKLMTAVVAHC